MPNQPLLLAAVIVIVVLLFLCGHQASRISKLRRHNLDLTIRNGKYFEQIEAAQSEVAKLKCSGLFRGEHGRFGKYAER